MRKMFGRNFKRLRQEKGLTQEEVEVRSGLSQYYISALEQGKRNPTLIAVYEISQALGVHYLELLQPIDTGDE